MKLTPRGRDYLGAALGIGLLSSVLDARIILALCLAMMIAGILSLALLSMSSEEDISIRIDNPRVVGFRKDELFKDVEIISKGRRFVSVRVVSITGPDGIESSFISHDAGNTKMSFKPAFAGRFVGLHATFELQDAFGLFSKRIMVLRPDFTIDSLPSSLLAPVLLPRPLSLSLGDRAGNTRGSSQDFLSIDEYHSYVEKKNIFWKKVARMPDERLLIKVREATIPKTLKIGFTRIVDRGQDSLQWTDAACEGVALVAKTLIEVGCDVEILHPGSGDVESSYASDLNGLSSAVMEMSASNLAGLEFAYQILAQSDICVVGLRDLEVDGLAFLIMSKPSLVINEAAASPKKIGDLAVVFTGNEDVSMLVNRVIGR